MLKSAGLGQSEPAKDGVGQASFGDKDKAPEQGGGNGRNNRRKVIYQPPEAHELNREAEQKGSCEGGEDTEADAEEGECRRGADRVEENRVALEDSGVMLHTDPMGGGENAILGETQVE